MGLPCAHQHSRGFGLPGALQGLGQGPARGIARLAHGVRLTSAASGTRGEWKDPFRQTEKYSERNEACVNCGDSA